MREVTEEEYAKIVDSSVPPPKRPQANNVLPARKEYFPSFSTKKKLSEEHQMALKEKGMTLCDLGNGRKVVMSLEDCVVRSPNWVQPKIEYLMDVLGPMEVTRRLRQAGLHWKHSGNVSQYKKLVHQMTLEVAERDQKNEAKL